MIIATTQDLADVGSCGCPCETPGCAAPQIEHRSLSGTCVLAWEIYDYPLDTYYGTKRSDWADGGFLQWRQSQHFSCYFDDPPDGNVSVASRITTSGTPQTGALTVTLSDPLDLNAALQAGFAALEAALDFENVDYSHGTASVPTREQTAGPSLDVTFVQCRVGVPEDYSTVEVPRSVFESQWDYGFFPAEWDAWKALHDAYVSEVAIHAAWEDEDPETRGDEPDVSADPGAEPANAPVFKSSDSWLWGGSMGAPWSGWFDLPSPEADGEMRRVNLMTKCYHSTRLGVKPTAHGEQHVFAA